MRSTGFLLLLPLLTACAAAPAVDPYHPRQLEVVFARIQEQTQAGAETPPGVKAAVLAELDRVLRARPLCHPALLVRSRLALSWCQPELALADVTVLESSFGSEVETLELRGRALWQLGRAGEAALTFREVLELDPKNVQALLHLGIALAEAGRTGPALRYLGKALELDPRNRRAEEEIALCHVARGKADFLALMAQDDPERLRRAGLFLAATGHHRRAVEALARAARSYPRDRELLWALARSLAARRLRKHLARVAQALEGLAPKDPAWLLRVGDGLLELDGGAELAASMLSRAAERFADDPRLRRGAARALAATGDLVGATRAFEAALVLEPASGPAYRDYALFLAQANLREEALAVCRRGLAQAPGDERLRAQLMVILFASGYLREARALHTELAAKADALPPDLRALLARYAEDAS